MPFWSRMRRRKDEQMHLGQILLDMGVVEPEDVDLAVKMKLNGSADRKIGDILMGIGKVTEAQVEFALGFQKRLHNGENKVHVMADIVAWRTPDDARQITGTLTLEQITALVTSR